VLIEKLDLKVSPSILKSATVRLTAVRLRLLSRSQTSTVIHGSIDLFNGRAIQPAAVIDAARRLCCDAVVTVMQTADFWNGDNPTG
jgi:hypothetical protein